MRLQPRSIGDVHGETVSTVTAQAFTVGTTATMSFSSGLRTPGTEVRTARTACQKANFCQTPNHRQTSVEDRVRVSFRH